MKMYKFENKSNKTDEMLFMDYIMDKTLQNKKNGVCCICGKPYDNYGNNAKPYRNGRCCDECNNQVMAYRFALLFNSKNGR